jgi:hypothetical protein
LGPCLLPDKLIAQRFLDILEIVLLGLLEDLPLAVRKRFFPARRSFKTLGGRRSTVDESDISRKVDWASRDNYMVFSATRYNFLWKALEGTRLCSPLQNYRRFVARIQIFVTTVDAKMLRRVREHSLWSSVVLYQMDSGSFENLL